MNEKNGNSLPSHAKIVKKAKKKKRISFAGNCSGLNKKKDEFPIRQYFKFKQISGSKLPLFR